MREVFAGSLPRGGHRPLKTPPSRGWRVGNRRRGKTPLRVTDAEKYAEPEVDATRARKTEELESAKKQQQMLLRQGPAVARRERLQEPPPPRRSRGRVVRVDPFSLVSPLQRRRNVSHDRRFRHESVITFASHNTQTLDFVSDRERGRGARRFARRVRELPTFATDRSPRDRAGNARSRWRPRSWSRRARRTRSANVSSDPSSPT